MVNEKLTIKNASGLHMRPAGIFVKEAAKFKSDVNLKIRGNTYNVKSMIALLSAAVKCNDVIELEINGEDEKECFEALKALVESGIGE
jgi:phosphocarrier protein